MKFLENADESEINTKTCETMSYSKNQSDPER